MKSFNSGQNQSHLKSEQPQLMNIMRESSSKIKQKLNQLARTQERRKKKKRAQKNKRHSAVIEPFEESQMSACIQIYLQAHNRYIILRRLLYIYLLVLFASPAGVALLMLFRPFACVFLDICAPFASSFCFPLQSFFWGVDLTARNKRPDLQQHQNPS